MFIYLSAFSQNDLIIMKLPPSIVFQYAVFQSRGHLDYIFSEIWYSIEKQVDLQLNYLRNEQFVYVLPSDYAFDNHFNKVELWIPIEKQF